MVKDNIFHCFCLILFSFGIWGKILGFLVRLICSNKCEVSVPITLAGMHECEPNKKVKRFKGVGFDVEKKQSFWDQLIVMAPFHFFMYFFQIYLLSGFYYCYYQERVYL